MTQHSKIILSFTDILCLKNLPVRYALRHAAKDCDGDTQTRETIPCDMHRYGDGADFVRD